MKKEKMLTLAGLLFGDLMVVLVFYLIFVVHKGGISESTLNYSISMIIFYNVLGILFLSGKIPTIPDSKINKKQAKGGIVFFGFMSSVFLFIMIMWIISGFAFSDEENMRLMHPDVWYLGLMFVIIGFSILSYIVIRNYLRLRYLKNKGDESLNRNIQESDDEPSIEIHETLESDK